MSLHKLLITAMWAGVISLDFTAFGPFMVSQPMVCGPIFGWWLGQTAVGLMIGGVVQLLWMDLSPVGVGIPYDATATTILAVYWATLPTGQAGLAADVHDAASAAFFHGFAAGNLVAAGVAAAGAVMAIALLPAQPPGPVAETLEPLPAPGPVQPAPAVLDA